MNRDFGPLCMSSTTVNQDSVTTSKIIASTIGKPRQRVITRITTKTTSIWNYHRFRLFEVSSFPQDVTLLLFTRSWLATEFRQTLVQHNSTTVTDWYLLVCTLNGLTNQLIFWSALSCTASPISSTATHQFVSFPQFLVEPLTLQLSLPSLTRSRPIKETLKHTELTYDIELYSKHSSTCFFPEYHCPNPKPRTGNIPSLNIISSRITSRLRPVSSQCSQTHLRTLGCRVQQRTPASFQPSAWSPPAVLKRERLGHFYAYSSLAPEELPCEARSRTRIKLQSDGFEGIGDGMGER